MPLYNSIWLVHYTCGDLVELRQNGGHMIEVSVVGVNVYLPRCTVNITSILCTPHLLHSNRWWLLWPLP